MPGTPVDPAGAIPGVAAALATLVRPALWRQFVTGAASAYSLTPAAWQTLLAQAEAEAEAEGHAPAATEYSPR